MKQEKDGWLTPVPKQSLSKMVVEKIKEGVVSGAIAPGDFLPSEAELSERFGVGGCGDLQREWKQNTYQCGYNGDESTDISDDFAKQGREQRKVGGISQDD